MCKRTRRRPSTSTLVPSAAPSPNTGQGVIVDLVFLGVGELWLATCDPLWPIRPLYCQGTGTPAIGPAHHAMPICPDQLGNRNSFIVIFVHWLLTFLAKSSHSHRGIAQPKPLRTISLIRRKAEMFKMCCSKNLTPRGHLLAFKCLVQILWSGSVAASTIASSADASNPMARDRTTSSTTSIRR